MTASTFAVALADHLLAAHPAARPVGRADLGALPAPLAHYLDRWLAQHVARGAAALDTPWVAADDDVAAAQAALVAAVQRHAQIPADRWEQVLRYAVARVVGHLIRPADAIAKTVAEAGDGPYSVETVRDRLGWFVAHPALHDVVASYFDWKNVERIDAGELQQLLRRIDQRLTEEETPSEWVGHVAPLFDLAALLPGQGRLVPVPLLRAYLDARALGAGALRDLEEDRALSEAELLAFLQTPPDAAAGAAAGAAVGTPAYNGAADEPSTDAAAADEAAPDESAEGDPSGEATFDDAPAEADDTLAEADASVTEAPVTEASAWEPPAYGTETAAPEEDTDGEHAYDDGSDDERAYAEASPADTPSYPDASYSDEPSDDDGTAEDYDAAGYDAEAAYDAETAYDAPHSEEAQPYGFGDEAPEEAAADEAEAKDETSDAYAYADEATEETEHGAFGGTNYETGDYEADRYEADEEDGAEDEDYVPYTGSAPYENAYPSAADFITPGSFDDRASDADEAYTDEVDASAASDDDAAPEASPYETHADEAVDPPYADDDWRGAPISDALDPTPAEDAPAAPDASVHEGASPDAPSASEGAPEDEEALADEEGTSLQNATRDDQPLWTHFASPPAPRINDRFAQADDEAAPPPEEEKKVPLWRQFFTGGDSGPAAAAGADPSETASPESGPSEPGPSEPETSRPESDPTERPSFFGHTDAPQAWGEAGAFRRASGSAPETAHDEGGHDEPAAYDAPADRSAPVDLGALEHRLLGDAAGQRDWFVTQLTQGDEDAYREVLRALDAAPTWTDASQIIARDIFRRFRINIYSAPAIAFTDAVEAHFRAER